jgi:hypothetical protein
MAALAMRRLPLVAEPPRPRLVALPGGAAAAAAPRSLDDVLTGAWSALRAGDAAPCLLCGGTMAPRWTAGAGVMGGRCRTCGTELD